MEKTQTTLGTATSVLGRLFRIVLFVLTAGFAYPYVCTEGIDAEKQ